MSKAMLTFRDVTYGYHASHPIIEHFGFELHEGRIMAILGPNGVGKTTLLYLALGWLPVWSGEILFTGRPLREYSRMERGRQLAYVPQNEHTPFDYSVLEYVLMGRAPHIPPLGMPGEVDYEAALAALEQVGLRNLADHPVPHLSSGEHQLMLLARAVVQDSPLLLLDEPTAHLDLHNKALLIRMLSELRSQGVTLLMTNHEPDIVLALADDVLLMGPGKTAAFGPLEEVFTSEALSRLYNLPIRLVEVEGHRQVQWT